MSKSKIAMGFLIGAAAGAVLGILFAPDEGKKTRKKISQKSTDISDNLKESFNDFVDGIKKTYSKAKGQAEDMVETGKAKMNTFKNEMKNTVS
jgi:gas vesicle protein